MGHKQEAKRILGGIQFHVLNVKNISCIKMCALFSGMRFTKSMFYFNSFRQESFVDTKTSE